MAGRPTDSGIRVLIVDDHALMREGLAAIIALEPGLEVIGEAGNGRDGVRIAVERQPDVVLMDLVMPEMNGISATQQLRERVPGAAVLAMSSHRDSRLMSRALDAGAAGLVLKSNAFREVRRGIKAVHQGRSYFCGDAATCGASSDSDKAFPAVPLRHNLGNRELEILQLLAEGMSSSKIAAKLHISVSTVDTHRRNIMRKLKVNNVVELTRLAIREGLTGIE